MEENITPGDHIAEYLSEYQEEIQGKSSSVLKLLASEISVDSLLLCFDAGSVRLGASRLGLNEADFASVKVGDWDSVEIVLRQKLECFHKVYESGFIDLNGIKFLIINVIDEDLPLIRCVSAELMSILKDRFLSLRYKSVPEGRIHKTEYEFIKSIIEKDCLVRGGRKLLTLCYKLSTSCFGRDLFDYIDTLSSMPYEGQKCFGKIIFYSDINAIMNFDSGLKFVQQLTEDDIKAVRKMLEMTKDSNFLISNGFDFDGIGTLKQGHGKEFLQIKFEGYHQWILKYSDDILMIVKNGLPSLPTKLLEYEAFELAVQFTFGATNCTKEQIGLLYTLLEKATLGTHGALIIISQDAENEADRISPLCVKTVPNKMSDALISDVTSIDGAILLDLDAKCYAVGAILDGTASAKGKPARGSRYNSCVRYVDSSLKERNIVSLGVVVSVDGGVDIISSSRDAEAFRAP